MKVVTATTGLHEYPFAKKVSPAARIPGTIVAGKFFLACPFFHPTERADDLAFPHPARLPLGAAWRGSCGAPGHECTPSNSELEACNLGYAKSCSRLPSERSCDAVRFGIANDSGARLSLQFVFETAHQPAGHGHINYDRGLETWTSSHPDSRIQKMAECFLQSYLQRRNGCTSRLKPEA